MTAFDDSAVNSRPTKNCDEIVGPADNCVVTCVNIQCEPVVNLNGNISLVLLGLTAEFRKYKK
jgi:hypothetical protein